MNVVLISQVFVGVLQADGTGRQVPVLESPFYRTLDSGSREPFESYRSVLMKVSGTPEREMSCDEFIWLFKQIVRDGFIPMLPRIRFDDNMVCLDGHHRLAILLAKHGPHLGLQIENNEVHALWERLRE